MDKPPLDIEQAIDLILAIPSMFSKSSEGQRDFGKLIVGEYYSKLRLENKDDPIAYRYLINLFAVISSAVRAFAVQRDIFESHWKSIEDIRRIELNAAERLTDYSPFREGSFWNKMQGFIISLFGGGSIGAAIGVFIRTDNYHSILMFSFILLGWILAIIGLDYWLQKRKDNRISDIMTRFPTDITEKWKQETIPQYKTILKNFLYLAIKIREEYYPNLPTIENTTIYSSKGIPHIQYKHSKAGQIIIDKDTVDEYLNKIIDRHFAF